VIALAAAIVTNVPETASAREMPEVTSTAFAGVRKRG
jgi:hypothetical protein